MSSMPEQHSTFVVAVLYTIPCCMGPWYIGSLLNIITYFCLGTITHPYWDNAASTSGRQCRHSANVIRVNPHCCLGAMMHTLVTSLDGKVHGANMGPIWGRQDPGRPHVGPMNFAIYLTWDQWIYVYFKITNGRFCAVIWAVLSSVHDTSMFENLEYCEQPGYVVIDLLHFVRENISLLARNTINEFTRNMRNSSIYTVKLNLNYAPSRSSMPTSKSNA